MSWIDELNVLKESEIKETVDNEILPVKSIETTEQFNEAKEVTETIIGNPEKDMEHWHYQEHPMSCAVTVQEFIAEALLGDEYSESKMRAYAKNHNLFNDKGTTLNNVGKLLEFMGLDVTREYGQNINDIAETLKNNGKVIVGVNNMVLNDIRYADLPGIKANHVVEVIGIDTSNADNIEVIFNDSGVKNGAGRRVPLKTFQEAWESSNKFMASVYRK